MVAPDAGRLPLPVAALVLEARNRIQREPTRAHLCAYFAWEASVRLAVAAQPPTDVGSLAMPSVGDLVHGLPASTTTSTNRALLDVAVLLAGSGAPKSTTRSKVLEFLPKYRNEHFHGGISRVDEDARAARVLLAGIEAAWQEGLFWTPSNALVYVDAVEIDSFGRRRAHVFVLEGLASQAELPDESLHSVEAQVLPARVYLRAEARYRSLHPWIVYDDGRVLFFNGMKGRGAKYLDYAKNDHVASKSLVGRLPQLDAELTALFGKREDPGHALVEDAPPSESPGAPPPETVRSRTRSPFTTRRVALVAVAGVVLAGAAAVATKQMPRHDGPDRLAALPGASASASATAPSPGAGELDVPIVSKRPAVQESFRRAVDAFLATDIESSVHAFEEASSAERDEPWPHLGLGMAYALEQRFNESIAEQKAAQSLGQQGHGDARDRELLALVGTFDSPEFVAGYAAFRAHNPRYFLGMQVLAYFGTLAGSPEDRRGRVDAALAIDDRHPMTYLTKSVLLQRLGDLDGALAALRDGLERQTTAPWLVDQRGVLHMAVGDVEAAKGDFRLAMAHHGPYQATVHYAVALVRSGSPADAAALRSTVDSMLGGTDANQRVDDACQVVMALYARGKIHDADALLHAALDDRPGSTAPGPGAAGRCLIPPLWVSDALDRLGSKEGRWQLDTLRGLFHRPQLSNDTIGTFQWSDATLHGIAAAQAGHLTEAKQELQSLEEAPSTDPLHVILQAELSERIELAARQTVTVRQADAGAGLLTRARVAHVEGLVGEANGDDAGAVQSYSSLASLAKECANTDAPFAMPCAAYVADGLARLATLHAKHDRRDDRTQVVAAFDALWPNPDADLGPVKTINAVRHRP